ncbi:ABC transporter substrate-binding protein [Candidatus Thioglobus sp.]|uniref:MlaC/ttg2D family ABC transporter substrate-binding protein n=1 Tax=Candidatus Thioglobus sp. TaxID=2026721 RepID=UPI00262D264C|nr:ABC transporter substrate-binding protein [Candidatus Thioglobus sp.]MDG2395734.1 ABC transporter substrate-binding protein [Candidatus Thioglobus sp.]
MIKALLIILAILHINLAFAQTNPQETQSLTPIPKKEILEILDPPGTAALNIMLGALSSFKALKKSEQDSLENTKSLVRMKILPFIDLKTSAKITLKDHWNKLDLLQKQLFIDYISHSLIKDYVGMLHSYEKLDLVEISLHKKIKRRDNKAIVRLEVKPNADAKPILITLKMIRDKRWKIYDVVFSGVSVIKNYRAQFNSHIKRKGLESLIKKTIKKLNKQ